VSHSLADKPATHGHFFYFDSTLQADMAPEILGFVLERYIRHIAKNYWRNKVYEPLDSTRREIRIVKVLPRANLDDDLVCNLDVITLDSSTKFAALSYVGGDQTNPQYITLEAIESPLA
jgi:hypothetical protein